MSQRVTAFRTGTKTVATPGTPVQLVDAATPAAVEAATVAIQALATNTGNVVVGDSHVVAGPGTQGAPTQRGIRLTAGTGITIDLIDITQVWVDAVTAGDGVSWLIGVA